MSVHRSQPTLAAMTMFPRLPYSMLIGPLPPYYLPPAPIPPPPDPVRTDLPPPGTYLVDPARSSVTFTARELGVLRVRGRLTGISGRIEIGLDAEHSRVDVEVPLAGMATGNRRRDRDLLGPRFFDAAAHPTLFFTGTRLGANLGAWALSGTAQVRGICAPVALRLEPVRRRADGTVTVRARAEVDRVRFGIRAPRALIGRWVQVELEVNAS